MADETSRITRIWAKNFRSVADSSLELGPVTVLVGPNGSGKSNLLDVAGFLGDALRTNLDTAFSARQGFESVRMRDSEPNGVEMGVRYETGGLSIDYDFAVEGNEDGGCRVTRERIVRSSGCERFPSIKIQNGNLVSPEELIGEIGGRFKDGDTDFATDDLALPNNLRLITGGTPGDKDSWFHNGFHIMRSELARLRIYRLFPNTMRQPQKARNPRPLEPDGGNLASALRELDKKHPDSMGLIKTALCHIIPFITDLRVVPAGGFLVTQLKHGDVSVGDEDDAWFDLTQESDGTVRMLGILTALYQKPYLPLIGIEEPELNVYPGAFEALGEVIHEAARRSQMLITTHSPDLIDKFRAENILVVSAERGITTAGPVSKIQMKVARRNLFSPGELHRMEGLRREGAKR